ncbi:class I SAM-dependent methyltransferase [Fundidesulfovibrio terrae]|uniref:class I SAM-dependent methyltransferase n=1 Tax=Fundidesulfovibrio terrae TaxID=2922866 RepID=UPI001FAF6008|nr:class I SAM-dependent methyltransferase [Fundidesulfovibrio terrae]
MDTVGWYQTKASELSTSYEGLSFEDVHGWLIPMLPKAPSVVLDVGAGTGRDAAWLSSKGYEVFAVEPSAAMRAEGQKLHPDARINWLVDKLPGLDQTLRLGISFDSILLSAVWMHLPSADRPRAFRKLLTLLKPGGVLAMSLRHGPAEPERFIHEVSLEEVEKLAREHGAYVAHTETSEDSLGRKEISWTQVAIRLPDDGTGALPLLRHVILNDKKSSTYKLALLRVLCRIADGAAGMARDAGDDFVSLPLGLVALNWIRMFKPLLAADLPQTSANRLGNGLGFVNEGFRKLSSISHLDLRIGMSFSGEIAQALFQAIRESCKIIDTMPATYLTFPDGNKILKVIRETGIRASNKLTIDETFLLNFGEMYIPRNIWRTLQRFDVWIEPSLIAEWVRLMKSYAASQGRLLDDVQISQAMFWSDPTRDVRVAKDRALRLMSQGVKLYCVWSEKKLDSDNIDIDHCFPWSAWPCDDLWNLLPSHRSINQHKKRDRLPSEIALARAGDLIQKWWNNAYLESNNTSLLSRFELEAKSTLPGVDLSRDRLDISNLFDAVNVQRIRLRHDQQIPEWTS